MDNSATGGQSGLMLEELFWEMVLWIMAQVDKVLDRLGVGPP